ncbi:hypothetical protein KL86DPRO_11832 [uncultured delta proteobacterium]|uniref:Uncharacterized protein n=1 Tax=uncultured delta proteobacterium TaxID=34034 RepID=A0A212JMP4_9DELT|nr:hypothetical protein KL86DPRO_11832 [uncultured delta proteobacterium]
MPKPIPERICAIMTVLERLAADIEIIRKGADALALALPQDYEPHRHLLAAQAAALERIATGIGMVRETVASLEEIRGLAKASVRKRN